MATIPHGPSGLTIASSCPPPFLNEADYPPGNGYVAGRICQPISTDLTCCLPCPQLDWFYPVGFYHRSRNIGYVATASMVLAILMLISWAVLPTATTKRHYLNVALVFSVFLAELGLSLAILRKAPKCFDPITPNNQRTSMTCGWSGPLLFGGCAAVDMWVLIRAVTMHLLIVWDISPPSHNFLISNLFGWGVAGIILTTSLTVSGYSSLVGDICITNTHRSWQSYWGPLLAICGIGAILTAITAGYCTFIYMRSLLQGSEPLGKGSNPHGRGDGLNSPATPRATSLAIWRRVRAVLRIQWRPIVITTLVLAIVIVAAAIAAVAFNFVGKAQNEPQGFQKWLLCLAISPNDHDACLKELPPGVPTEASVLTPFYLISTLGFVVFATLGTKGMITGWWDLIRGKSETPLKLNTERFSMKRKRSSNGNSNANTTTSGVNKADISRPRFPRFSFQPNPAAASVPATHPDEAQPESSIEPFEAAHVPQSLTMGGPPLGPIPKPLATGPREETSRTALTAAYSTANDVQTPQKRGMPGAGLGVGTPRNRGSSGMQVGEGPLNFHPVEGHDGEGHDGHDGDEEDENENESDSLFEESLVGQTPSKVV